MAIVLDETRPSKAAASPPRVAQGADRFPVALAEAYALQFGDVYLNASPATANQRAQQLAAFVPSDVAAADPQLGWNGSGTLRLESEQVAGVRVQDAHYAIVTLLADVNGALMELGVPIYASHGALAVSGEPAWLAAPAQASPPAPTPLPTDQAAQAALMSQLPAFFQAYASGDSATLNRFLAPGSSVSGLGGTVSFGGISGLYVPPGGATRDIVVTVAWRLPGGTAGKAGRLDMTYGMTVEDQGGKWYVRRIDASTQQQEAGT